MTFRIFDNFSTNWAPVPWTNNPTGLPPYVPGMTPITPTWLLSGLGAYFQPAEPFLRGSIYTFLDFEPTGGPYGSPITGIISTISIATAGSGLTVGPITAPGSPAGSGMYVRQADANTTVAASSLIAGNVYQIAVVGTTNWTSIGAASATVGQVFTKNSTAVTGSGGTAYSPFVCVPLTGGTGSGAQAILQIGSGGTCTGVWLSDNAGLGIGGIVGSNATYGGGGGKGYTAGDTLTANIANLGGSGTPPTFTVGSVFQWTKAIAGNSPTDIGLTSTDVQNMAQFVVTNLITPARTLYPGIKIGAYGFPPVDCSTKYPFCSQSFDGYLYAITQNLDFITPSCYTPLTSQQSLASWQAGLTENAGLWESGPLTEAYALQKASSGAPFTTSPFFTGTSLGLPVYAFVSPQQYDTTSGQVNGTFWDDTTWTSILSTMQANCDGIIIFGDSDTGAQYAPNNAWLKTTQTFFGLPPFPSGTMDDGFTTMDYPGFTMDEAPGNLYGTAAITFGQSGVLAVNISGTASVVVGESAALSGKGALAGTPAITFSQSASISATSAVAGTASAVFGQTGALLGAGAMTGTGSVLASQSASLKGAGSMVSQGTIEFLGFGRLGGPPAFTGTMDSDAPMDGTFTMDSAPGGIFGTASMAFAETAALMGVGALAGDLSAIVSESGTLKATGTLAGITSAVFGQSATPSLSGHASITFGLSGTLGGNIVGTASIVTGASGTLLGTGAILGTVAVTFGETGQLAALGVLAGTGAVEFDASATPLSLNEISGTGSIIFSQSGTIAGPLAAIAPIIFSQSGTLRATAPLEAGGSISVGATGTLTALGALVGIAQTQFDATGVLSQPGIAGTVSMSFGATGLLQGIGELDGTTAFEFDIAGTIGGNLAGTISFAFGQSGTLTAVIPPPPPVQGLSSFLVERAPFNSLVTVQQRRRMQTFGLLYPGEKQLLTFSFVPVLLDGNLLMTSTAPVITVTCEFGNDNDPPAIVRGPGVVNVDEIELITPAGGTITLPAQTAVQLPVQASQIPGAVYVIEVQQGTNISTIAPICAGRLTQAWIP